MVSEKISTRVRTREEREERYRRRYELPSYSHFGVGLNKLARQDKLPPVIGREDEIRQMMEILCHRSARTRRCRRRSRRRQDRRSRRTRLPSRWSLSVPQRPNRTSCISDVGARRRHDASRNVRGAHPGIINEVKERENSHPHREVHTIMGAGSAIGQSDAANTVIARAESCESSARRR
jgi:hypothetical protein